MDHAINAPCHGKIVADGLNSADKHYLKGKTEPIGKLGSNNTTKIGMLPSASKYVSIEFEDKRIHIINNKEILNGLKGSKKMKKR